MSEFINLCLQEVAMLSSVYFEPMRFASIACSGSLREHGDTFLQHH